LTADTRNVLTIVELSTELTLPTTVQSTSVSASVRDGVQLSSSCTGCGELSRSQRTPHVLLVVS